MTEKKEAAPGGEGRERINGLLNENLPSGAYLVRVTYTGSKTRRETVNLPIRCRKARRKGGGRMKKWAKRQGAMAWIALAVSVAALLMTFR